jgi:hypothetical protein
VAAIDRPGDRCCPIGSFILGISSPFPCGDVDPLSGFTFEQCDRLTGDSLDQPVTWRGNSDISSAGEMVAIRLKMFQAKLFAYQV